jgi:hypothetical protein
MQEIFHVTRYEFINPFYFMFNMWNTVMTDSKAMYWVWAKATNKLKFLDGLFAMQSQWPTPTIFLSINT